MRSPMPGKANIFSTITVPPSIPTNCRERTVNPAGAAARRTCLKIISRREIPRLVRVRMKSRSKTAFTAERICWAADVIVAMTNEMTGRVMDFAHIEGLSLNGVQPVAGKICKRIAKKVIKMIATMNPGIAKPATANSCTRRSIAPPLVAANTPSPVARAAAIKIAMNTNDKVTGNLRRISLTTESLFVHEIPKSP